MKVSMIMGIKDEEKYLRETLASIVEQTRKPDECVVILDGCTDNSGAILDSFANDLKIVKIVHENNRGLIETYNEGLQAATGDLFFTMAANDLCLPTFVEDLAETLEKNDEDIAYPYWYEVDETGNILSEFRAPDNYRPYMKVSGNCIAGCSLFRREIVDDVGLYRVSGLPADYDLWLRAIASGYEARLVPKFLYKWRRHPHQYSSGDLK